MTDPYDFYNTNDEPTTTKINTECKQSEFCTLRDVKLQNDTIATNKTKNKDDSKNAIGNSSNGMKDESDLVPNVQRVLEM